jgi:hypothetical protein
VAEVTKAHEAVLRLLDRLPEEIEADATLVAALLRIPEAEVLRPLEELAESPSRLGMEADRGSPRR